MRRRARHEGQATVELALLLPVVMALLLVVIQVALVVRDQVLVVHAAREAVRAAAVDGRPDAQTKAAAAGGPLDVGRLSVIVGPRGEAGSVVHVGVRYRSSTDVPIIGGLIGDVDLHAEASMRVEH